VNEIFSAIYTKLNTDLSVSVFDDVPQDIYNFPYVRIDPLTLNEADTDNETGFNATVQIIAFSQSKGSKEIADLSTQIYNSLHRFAMPDTASFGISTVHQEFSTIALESDGLTRQSIQRFNIIFEPLPA
jgi:hypothetical protein